VKRLKVEQLIAVLQQTEQAYGELLDIIIDEKETVRQAKVEGMLRISSDKERKLDEIKRLDIKRNQLLNEMAMELKVDRKDLVMRDLEKRVDPLHGRQLSRLRHSFQSILSKVRVANNESRALIHHCQSLVRQAISLVSPTSTASVMYQASGTMVQGAKGGKLVSNIA
jgi:hypothetical protein